MLGTVKSARVGRDSKNYVMESLLHRSIRPCWAGLPDGYGLPRSLGSIRPCRGGTRFVAPPSRSNRIYPPVQGRDDEGGVLPSLQEDLSARVWAGCSSPFTAWYLLGSIRPCGAGRCLTGNSFTIAGSIRPCWGGTPLELPKFLLCKIYPPVRGRDR